MRAANVMMRFAVTAMLPAATAACSSAIAAGQTPMFGVMVSSLDATVPAAVAATEARADYTHSSYWVHWRGGSVFDHATSQFGSPIGYEYEVKLGDVGSSYKESDGTSSGAFRAVLDLGVPIRVMNWNTIIPGAFVVHVGAEFAGGARQWWSEGSDTLGMLGARLVLHPLPWQRAELDWTVAPSLGMSGGPVDTQVSRIEQRITATLGFGAFGVGVRAMFFHESAAPKDVASFTDSGHEVTLILEYRYGGSRIHMPDE